MEKGERLSLLLGATWCVPCDNAAEWWKTKNIGPFDLNYLKLQDKSDWKTLGSFGGIFHNLDVDRMPILLFAHRSDKERQKYRHECILKGFVGYTQCTKGAAEWPNKNEHQRSIYFFESLFKSKNSLFPICSVYDPNILVLES